MSKAFSGMQENSSLREWWIAWCMLVIFLERIRDELEKYTEKKIIVCSSRLSLEMILWSVGKTQRSLQWGTLWAAVLPGKAHLAAQWRPDYPGVKLELRRQEENKELAAQRPGDPATLSSAVYRAKKTPSCRYFLLLFVKLESHPTQYFVT